MVEFIKNENVPEPSEVAEYSLLLIDRQGLIGADKAIRPPRRVMVICRRPDREAVPKHPPEHGIDEVALRLILQAHPGANPCNAVGKARSDKLPGLDRQAGLSPAGGYVGDDISNARSSDNAGDGLVKIMLVLS